MTDRDLDIDMPLDTAKMRERYQKARKSIFKDAVPVPATLLFVGRAYSTPSLPLTPS